MLGVASIGAASGYTDVVVVVMHLFHLSLSAFGVEVVVLVIIIVLVEGVLWPRLCLSWSVHQNCLQFCACVRYVEQASMADIFVRCALGLLLCIMFSVGGGNRVSCDLCNPHITHCADTFFCPGSR
jgi:hypothetical protein